MLRGLLVPAGLCAFVGLSVVPTRPVAAAGASAAAACLSDEDDFETIGGTPAFVVIIKNNCAKRFSCIVNANVTTALGDDLGKATMTLPPASHGPSQRSHSFKARQAAGSGAVSRQCKQI